MATYKATEIVYLSTEGRMVYADEQFTFDGPKGASWVEVDAKGNPVDPLDHDASGAKGGSRPRKTED